VDVNVDVECMKMDRLVKLKYCRRQKSSKFFLLLG